MEALKTGQRGTPPADRNPVFGADIAACVGGGDLRRCLQCGTCSGACPLSGRMQHTPRQIIGMTRAGMERAVLSSDSIWLCASCYACTSQCPKQIRVTDVMYILKRRAVRAGLAPRQSPGPLLAREFMRSVHRTGRSNEARTAARVLGRTRPLAAVRNAPLGLGLLRRGRMRLGLERMGGGLAQLQAILADAGEGGGSRSG